MSIIYLGLGTNLGDRLGNLRKAIVALAECCRVLDVSPVYETDPVGITDQPAFLNIALKAETRLEPQALLVALKGMEKTLGRTETVRWGPRQIDIDILLYDLREVHNDSLDIPHPRMCERNFVLAPLSDVGADAIYPPTNQTIHHLRSLLTSAGIRHFGDSTLVAPSPLPNAN